MQILAPKPNSLFTITSAPEWPAVAFQTDATGPHTWNWELVWGAFNASGSVDTPDNRWDAGAAVTNLGGSLTVQANANGQTAMVTVQIGGTNPSASEVTTYLASSPDSAGFEKIVFKESEGRQFNEADEPVKSFDDGYGMCQLTNPVPTFAQIWNWQLNLDGGLKLFAGKRLEAIAYLQQKGRSYTDRQLTFETVSRWNGGKYHVWDKASRAWIRDPKVLCDTATGNIGWDMTDPANVGKTEAQLHKRDHASYAKGPSPGAHWRYSGVCYADLLLG